MDNIKIVFAGHVDHGKSTLIGRLLYDTKSISNEVFEEVKKTCESLGRDIEFGFVLDYLEEEREQGITIDTTQIFFSTKKRNYVIIDAPGHKEFMKNMITGASQADVAVLIVDAKEGVQEQTRRHAYMLQLLGIKQLIVVVNKMDLVDYKEKNFTKTKNKLKTFLNLINMEPLTIIPIAAKAGDNIVNKSDNMSWYNGKTLVSWLDDFNVQISLNNKPLRFPIQDVYKVNEKRIIVGRVESGILNKGDKLYVNNKHITIRDIEEFLSENVKEAVSGKSTGFTVNESLFLDRGMVITDSEIERKNEIHSTIFWLDSSPFNKDDVLTIKCATQSAGCKIENIKRRFDAATLEEKPTDKIEQHDIAEVTIKTQNPLLIDNFSNIPTMGRFVLERKGNQCAGGIVTKE